MGAKAVRARGRLTLYCMRGMARVPSSSGSTTISVCFSSVISKELEVLLYAWAAGHGRRPRSASQSGRIVAPEQRPQPMRTHNPCVPAAQGGSSGDWRRQTTTAWSGRP